MTITFGADFIPRDFSTPVMYGRKRRRSNGGGSTLSKITSALANRLKTSRSSTRSVTRSKRMYDSGPITEQHDAARRYLRRPMPRFKRRRWRSFTKRVQHVMLQSQALMSYTRDLTTSETWLANKQVTFGYYLGGTLFGENDELNQAFRSAYGLITSTSLDDYKLFIKAMSLDLQLTNTGDSSCIVDVYTLNARKSSNAAPQSIGTQYSTLYLEQQPGQTGVGPGPDEPSSTPFQNGLFCSYWKVMQKKEILLGPGNVTTMQMRLPYNRMMYGKILEYNQSYIPGVTRAYLIQVRGTPEVLVGPPLVNQLSPGRVTVSRQWTVTFGIPPGNTRAQASDVV